MKDSRFSGLRKSSRVSVSTSRQSRSVWGVGVGVCFVEGEYGG